MSHLEITQNENWFEEESQIKATTNTWNRAMTRRFELDPAPKFFPRTDS
jgi:hypothetical protein